MMSPRPHRTEIGKPLPSALPRVVRSGVTPNRSCAPPGACRKPVMISSKIRSVPASVHASRSVSRNPGSGSTTPALWKTGSRITAAIVSPSRRSDLADARRVVVLADHHEVADGRRDARRRRDRCRIAVIVGGEVVAPRDVVVPAVVVALELEDALAAGERPREPDGVERRLGAGAAEDDPLGRRDHLDEPLSELDLERVRGRERHAMLVHRATCSGIDRADRYVRAGRRRTTSGSRRTRCRRRRGCVTPAPGS